MGYNSGRTTLKIKEGSALIVKRDDKDAGSLDSEYKFRDGLYQSFVSLTILCLVAHYGLYLNFPAILYSQINITIYQNGWVVPCLFAASLLSIGALIGGFFLGPISDKFGRKTTCILSATVMAATWAATYLLPENFDMYLLYFITFIGGLANSLTSSAIVYVSEVTNKHWRPVFLNVVMVLTAAGISIAAIVGIVLSWRSYALFCLIMAILNILIIFFVPESPHWLIRSDSERAKRVLMKLNKNKKDFMEEWEVLETRRLVREDTNFKETRLLSREVRRPMLCLILIKTIQQLTGVFIIAVYALQMSHAVSHSTPLTLSSSPTSFNATLSPTLPFSNGTLNPNRNQKHLARVDDAENSTPPTYSTTSSTSMTSSLSPASISINATSHLNPNERRKDLDDVDTLCYIGIGLIRVVMSSLTAFLAKQVNNRFMLISSAFGGAIFAVALAVVSSGLVRTSGSVLPLVLIFLFYGALCFGVVSIPTTLAGELIPLSYRAKGTGIIVSYENFVDVVMYAGFPYALDWVGIPGLFVFFGVFSGLMCVYVYFCIPETRGKTFAEIEESFK